MNRRRLLWMLAIVFAGCGGSEPHPAPGSEAESCPGLCFPGACDPACGPPELPVRACATPVHPELVGLWGQLRRGGYGDPNVLSFDSKLLYDGCTVTFEHYELSVSIDEIQRELAGHPTPHVRLAHRAHAIWQGDLLIPDAEVCCFGLPIARRELGPDGTPRLALVNAGRRCPTGCGESMPLTRLDPDRCLDPGGYDMLCAREIVARASHSE